jgi:hypothetical protein
MLRRSALYTIALKQATRAVLTLQILVLQMLALQIFAPAGTAEPQTEATARSVQRFRVHNEYGIVTSPDLQLREDHAA